MTNEQQKEYLEEGTWPDELEDAEEEPLAEDNAAVQEQFEQMQQNMAPDQPAVPDGGEDE